MSRVLRTVVFIGSTKDLVAPWGGDKRLGDRVIKYVTKFLDERKSMVGDTEIRHEVTVYDPLKVFGPGGALEASGAGIRHPQFYYGSDGLPAAMKEMQAKIKAADCYLVISPEYNHSVPPALSGLMGHFGGSNYAYKASGIITYSVGPWGGMRAAIALRPMLSELGCLPVSKLCGFPSVAELLTPDGEPIDPANRMLNQLPGLLDQLEWVATAFADQREKTNMV